MVSSGRYPSFSRLARVMLEGRDLDPEQNFDIGMACLLDGVAAQLEAKSDGAVKVGRGDSPRLRL